LFKNNISHEIWWAFIKAHLAECGMLFQNVLARSLKTRPNLIPAFPRHSYRVFFLQILNIENFKWNFIACLLGRFYFTIHNC
jgi:hypothetical protein